MSIELFEALENHDLPRLIAALARGDDPNNEHPNQPSWTPLKTAIEELSNGGPIEAVVILLRGGAEVDGGQIPGRATPLLVAVMNRQPEVVRLLLALGANPSIRDDEGDTPLGLCIKQNGNQTADFLRLCGAKA